MADNLSGKSFGRYHLLEKIGEGGMAVVYKALDTTLQRHVAVKVILPYRALSDNFLTRFKREARALAKLSHPNIIKIFDFGEFDNQPYLVMEYIPGGTLKDLLKGKPVPWQKAAQILTHVARALEAAHAEGIIHRDVKPSNILMANERDPMLSDFGIAKLIEGSDETTDLTGSGVGIGTPDYMAPEQGVGKVDERADVYALGVIFYQMVTGRLPYEADTPMAVMLKKSTEPLPRPTQYVRSLPPAVENLLIKALALDPKHRYKDMREFALALERLNIKADTLETITDMGSDLPTMDQLERTEDDKRRAKSWLTWALPAGVLITCCGALFGGIFLWQALPIAVQPTNQAFSPTSSSSTATGKPPLPSPTLEQPPPNASSSPEPEQLPSPLPSPEMIPAAFPTSSSPNAKGRLIAFNSRMGGNADIYLIDTNGNNLTQATTSSAHDMYPAWSPDGERIAYQTNEGGDWEIAVIDVSSKKVTLLTRNTCNDWGPTWSPDGDWIAFYSDCDGDRNIYKMHADGGSRTRLTFTSGSYSWFPSWSPDSGKITFTSNRSGRYRIYVMNADGSNVRELALGCVSYFSPDGTQILYGRYCDDTGDLFLMNADGSNQRSLTDGLECKNATWLPDGTHIIFQLSRTTKEGPFALYIMSLDKPQRSDWTLLTDYNVNGNSPVWQP